MPEHIQETAPASLIVIGPSPTEDPETLDRGKLQALVLVEPDPERAARLSEHFETRTDVMVIPAAVGKRARRAELREFNFPGLRSIRSPAAALRKLLPGIRVRQTIPVDVVTPQQMLAQISERIGALPEPVHLYINLPGSEMDILRALHESGGMERLALIRARCSAEKMFKGAQSLEGLRDWMQTQPFLARIDRSDPDWPYAVFRIDPLVRTLEEADRKLADQAAELARKGARVAALEKQLEDAQAQLQAGQKRITGLEASEKAARERAAALEKQLEAFRAELQTQEGRITQLQARETATAARAETSAQALASARSDLSVAMRAQMIAQSDLRELQARFAVSERARVNQEELLRKLTPRLQEASQQLQLLAAPKAGDREDDA